MRALLSVVSLLWVFPSAYRALPNALLIHGEPKGSIIPSHREKRAENVTVSCSSHEYKSTKGNYCCNKCLAGHKVQAHCSGYGQATQCVPCDDDTYSEIPNESRFCLSCTSCVPQYGQIEKSACTTKRNTECGCPVGYFKEYHNLDFLCQECTVCENGTELMRCHDDKDTICHCFHNFFFDHSKKRCRPCSECEESNCKDHCPNPEMAAKPEESNGTILVIVGAVMSVIFAAVGVYAVYILYTRRHPSSSDVFDTDLQGTVTVHHQESEEKKLLTLPEFPPDTTHFRQQPLTNGTPLPLPDITEGTTTPCLNSPPVLYAIIESIPISRWREFVRRLGLSNHAIETAEQDHRHYKDAQYVMLLVWITQEGFLNSKRDQLFNVLREMNLGGCIEKIEVHL